jgi:hypothetical protein
MRNLKNGRRSPGGQGRDVRPDNDDDDWKAAEVELEAARRLPGGAERIEALRRAGRLRFDADRRRLAKEERQRDGSKKAAT